MANEESPVNKDVPFNSTAMQFETDDPMFDELAFITKPDDFDDSMSELNSENERLTSIEGHISNSSLDFLENTSISSSEHVIDHQVIISLSFINPPEPYYHVRYVSEITDTPLNGCVVSPGVKTKKNLSGRYLKAAHGRHVTIRLPHILFESSNLYIRVTRLTVPYQDISFIHPYPLYYSSKKNKSLSEVIATGSSLYFKLTKEEIRSCSKQFPNIILTRHKQCDLNEMHHLYPFDNKDMSYPFIGTNPKDKIMRYQLKKSQLDFRLVSRCNETQQFDDTGVFCRSYPLLEAEGVEWRRSSM